MQLNRERRRRICKMLHKTLPEPGTAEFELWTQNQQRSPLLRLPPELRNRIYELVLDVGQINVCFKKWEHKPRTRNGQRYYATTEGGFWCRILEKDQNPWRQTNNKPLHPPPRHGMTLLSPVCRQLYHETVLLPYRLNAWSFESFHVMDRYVMKEKRLPLAHRRAIRLLYTQTVLPVAVEKYLGGLEVVVLETGLTMVKRTVEAGPEQGCRKTVVWDVYSRKWK
ncbi:317dfd0c-4ecc-4b9c-9101-940c9446d809 [Thermothielavioides terrestris]|uniref:DUF7730 domain-containing protein n=2 Tax=Thermothielavioides terrestris TaxID=2587410 RepID=G2R099_THETT|nr:uncharacterized protein THITE_2116170 [Thermothielavioides terrestris NRRL 8126]AEO67267.1 hypothetical protein THITE_2116170 [Thermothielavioides terrestris NRRL 8126]SPQ23975.1 317dfd0c-4ecc-4b9c-9101-940c9446d809 [Thermothielavioides terrestris]